MSSSLLIEDNLFSSQTEVLIIAEIGTGHNGSIQKAKELVLAAKEAGANAVKFQIVYADEILHPNTGLVCLPTGKISLYNRFKDLERPLSFYQEIKAFAQKQNILFSASPFGLQSAKELQTLKPPFFKIASPELNHFPLLQEVSTYNKPIILSSGVSKLSDIEKALEVVRKSHNKVALLHCVTSYPAPETDYNLALLPSLQTLFNCPVGVSDHSMDPFLVPSLAVAKGACIIEKHICLSRTDAGLDDPVALPNNLFADMIQTIRLVTGKTEPFIIEFLTNKGFSLSDITAVIGSGEKKNPDSEVKNYGRTNRSIHYRSNMQKGDIITKEAVALLRTEKELTIGEDPRYLNLFIGSIVQRDISSGEGAQFLDIIQKPEEPNE